MDDLVRLSARAMVARLKEGSLSPEEAIDASLARIREVDPVINAVPTLCEKRARERAKKIPQAGRDDPGFLHGLPVLVKDLTDVEGVRTTYGSPLFADHVPSRSDYLVERLESMGGVVLGKTNTPEFGAGSQTFNEVFGKTRNPWNLSRTVGGSSGGAAAALATGGAWLASGSDLGGSLRNPASFCSVTGIRSSAGTVAHGPRELPFDTLMIDGPMARDVSDLALLLDAMAGFDPRDPISRPRCPDPDGRPATYQSALDVNSWSEAPVLRRIAWTSGFGFLPCDPEVAAAVEKAAQAFASFGAKVVEATPDLSDSEEIFYTLRGHLLATDKAEIYARNPEALKPDLHWNLEAGHALSREEIGRAERARGRLCARVRAFFDEYDLLLAPVAMVPPFDVDTSWPEQVEGRHFENYIGWIMTCAAVSLTDCPALSVPCGFTDEELPIGLQIVSPWHTEGRLLHWARRFEKQTGISERLPIDPVEGSAGRKSC